MTPEQSQEQQLQLTEQIDSTNVLQVQKMEKALEEAWFETDNAEYMKNYHFEKSDYHSEYYLGSAPTEVEINYLRSCTMVKTTTPEKVNELEGMYHYFVVENYEYEHITEHKYLPDDRNSEMKKTTYWPLNFHK